MRLPYIAPTSRIRQSGPLLLVLNFPREMICNMREEERERNPTRQRSQQQIIRYDQDASDPKLQDTRSHTPNQHIVTSLQAQPFFAHFPTESSSPCHQKYDLQIICCFSANGGDLRYRRKKVRTGEIQKIFLPEFRTYLSAVLRGSLHPGLNRL
jgi:hypothetical protein